MVTRERHGLAGDPPTPSILGFGMKQRARVATFFYEMRITIETDNVFYAGWLAYIFDLPVEEIHPHDESGQVFDEGYKMASETGPNNFSRDDLMTGKGIMKMRKAGVLYSALLAETRLGTNVKVTSE